MASKSDEIARLKQRARQFLVHSFLYYRLNESLIDDDVYDRIAGELRELRAKHPHADMPFAELIDPLLGPEASGFQIRHYPPEVVSTAFYLLYTARGEDVDFREFAERRGYRVELDEPA
jgi:NAD-dependent DNA ligase